MLFTLCLDEIRHRIRLSTNLRRSLLFASGLASWAYTKPAGATFTYYELRWLPYDSTKDLNDWTGKLNHVMYNESASSYQIPGLTVGTQYKAKLFVGIIESGKSEQTYVKSEVILFTP